MDRRTFAASGLATMGLAALGTPTASFGLATPRLRLPSTMGNPTLLTLSRHPILMQNCYRFSPGGQVAPSGAAGRNRDGIWMIEEQRGGGEYVLAGILSNQPAWREIGWRVLDWGNTQQLPSGEYKSRGAQYHSMSIFLHSLELACMADPEGATPERLEHLYRGAKWMAENMDNGLKLNNPYTHRKFLCMSVIGRAAFLTGQTKLYDAAFEWGQLGLKAQLPSGINPEAGGFDISYQMVGPYSSLYFMPVCPNSSFRSSLAKMCEKAIDWWSTHQQADGTIDPSGSTRVGIERQTNGTLKTVNYLEALKTLVLAGQELNRPDYLERATMVARHLR